MAVSLKKGVYIVSGKRTPFGKLGGMYKEALVDDLFAAAGRAALKAAGLRPQWVDTVNIGQTCGQYNANLSSHHAAAKVGVVSKPVLTLMKLSGSGLHAIVNSAQEILLGSAEVSLAGGMENFTSVPRLLLKARFDVPQGNDLVVENWLYKSYFDTYCGIQISEISDLVAKEFKITREETDEYAFSSQRKWKEAHDTGLFKEELSPVTLELDGGSVTLTTDEFPRPDTTLDSLSRLQPLFQGGVTTIGNVSGMNDGASAVILSSEGAILKHNLTPLSRVVGWSCVGVEPALMALGPVPAVRSLLDVTGLDIDDVDLVEIHETFATQVLACAKELTVDPCKLNRQGGAIAIGHPSGASGGRLVAHITHELRRRKLKRGLVCMCIAGGQGMAILIETV